MNLKRDLALRVDDDVWKYLNRIPHDDAIRIVSAMDGLVENPFGGDSKKMHGKTGLRRKRIGSYRILYNIAFDQNSIRVLQVVRRASNTY